MHKTIVNYWKVFIFNFKNPVKSILIWGLIFLYWFCVLLFVILIPLIKDAQPIEFIGDPTVSLIMVLFSSILIGVITVEIFRTPIDNGSELILLTKPISRLNIVSSKFIISFFYIIFISLFSICISSFSFLNKDWDYDQNIKISFGIGIGTFCAGFLMSSIASLFCLFFNKLKSLLFTMGFAFSIMLISFLGTYSTNNEIKYLEEKRMPIVTEQFLNIQDNKYSYISGFDESYVKAIDKDENIKDLFKKSKSLVHFDEFAKFDPGINLSSIFILNATSNNFLLQYRLQQIVNSPLEIKFNDVNLKDYVLSNLEYGLGPNKSNTVSIIPKLNFASDIYIKENPGFAFDKPQVSKSFNDNFFTKYNNNYLNEYWDRYWKKYGIDYQIPSDYDYTMIMKITNEIYSNFIIDKYKDLTIYTSDQILIDTSILALSAINKSRYISGNVDDLPFEDIVALKTAGFPIEWYLKNFYVNVNSNIFNGANNLELHIGNKIYVIYTPIWLVDLDIYNDYFIGAEIVRTNNLTGNIIFWTMLPLLLMIVTTTLYIKKDFS